MALSNLIYVEDERRGMNKGKLVSIIVPVYNAELYLGKVLRDLIEQTYQNLEIIIIDDGSTDNSWNIITKYIKEDNRVKAIQIENQGPSNARNVGIDMANGEYIRFIDADDRIPKSSVEHMAAVFSQFENIDLVIGNYINISEANLFTSHRIQNEAVDIETFLQGFIKNMKSFYYGVTWNKLYKRDIIVQNKLRFPVDIKWCEDLLFNLDYYEHCASVFLLYVEEGTYSYCLRENSITSTLNEETGDTNRIEKMRYERIIKICDKYGFGSQARIQWDYSDLYAHLALVTKEKDKTAEKYRKFKELLVNPEAYQFLYNNKDDYKIMRFLEYTVRKKLYWLAFIVFIGKSAASDGLNEIMPDVKVALQKLFPPRL